MAHFLTRNSLSQSAFDDVLDDVSAFFGNYISELKTAGESLNADIERQFRQAETVLKKGQA